MEEGLCTSAEVSIFMCGSNYPTLPIASLAFKCLLDHCNKYVSPRSLISETSSITEKVLYEAIKICLAYLNKYEDCLDSVPARISMFLDPR